MWQRGGGSGACCYERLSDIEVVLNASTVLSFEEQPDAYAQVNFGAELFGWVEGDWVPASCPAACGLGRSTRERNVSCVGDRGTIDPSACAAPSPPSEDACGRTSCCGDGGDVVFVSPSGDDTNSGCASSAPLATLRACAEAATDGTSCLLLPGTYREDTVVIRDLTNLTIAAAGGSGSVILDGTVALDGGWDALTDESGATYYRSQAPHGAWQLFLNGEPLTSARWPNAAAH